MSSDIAVKTDILIEAEELAALRAEGADLVILDARYDVTDAALRPASALAHIPGAVYVDLATELAGPQTATSGRRPLPDIRDLQRDARRWGINKDSHVVIYDGNKNVQASRVWWVLRWAGIERARLLNGGLKAWTEAGHEVTTDIALPATGDVELRAGGLPVADADDAAAIGRSGLLLDARDAKTYAGDPSKKDSGHIPGARSAPALTSLDVDGRFKDAGALREGFAALGADSAGSIATYCGAGVAAAHLVVALRVAGYDPALYPGSWSAWTSEPDRPVEQGDPVT